MVTISSILSSWLMSRQDYSEGVDIFQRLSNDKARLTHFLRFRSHMTENRLKEEIENLYTKSKQSSAVHSQELDPTDNQVQSLRLWLDMPLVAGDNMNYFEGVDLLESITGDNLLAAFFNNHISQYGRVQLRKALGSLHTDLEKLMAEKQKKASPVTVLDHLGAWLTGHQDYKVGVELLSKLTSDESLISFFQGDDTPYRQMRLQKELEHLFNELRAKEKQQLNATGETTTPAASNLAGNVLDPPAPAEFQLAREEQGLPDPAQQDSAAADTDLITDDSDVSDIMLAHVIDNIRKSLSKLRLKDQTPERISVIKKNEARLQTLLQRKSNLAQPV